MTTNQSSNLRPCPFCGGTNICTEKGINLNYCDSCSAEANIEHWNIRPIEDELRARIDKLTAENKVLEDACEILRKQNKRLFSQLFSNAYGKECEMRVFKDGNAWCFVLPDFQDLQVSSSVWMKEGVLDKIYKELRSVKNERQSASND